MKSYRAVLASAAAGLLWATAGSLVQQAPHKETARTNPFAGDAAAARAGEKLYARECAACHGAQREGSAKAPPLARPDIRAAAPGALFWVLRNGNLRRGMPSFASLPEPERWQIVTFVQDSK